jgi:hypothetical protein
MRRARIGRPGLIGTAARTAVVAGTASAVVRSGNRRAAAREQAAAGQPPPPPPAPVDMAPPSEDRIAQLERLAQLHASGVLTDDEFAAEKARILG